MRKYLWVRSARRAFSLAAIVVVPSLTACADAPSAPELEGLKPRRDAICVQTDENGTILLTQEPDATGGCGYGFELHVWN